jgi:hypothetical protein
MKQVSKRFFFENWARGGETSAVQFSRSFFASFFSKKEALAFVFRLLV